MASKGTKRTGSPARRPGGRPTGGSRRVTPKGGAPASRPRRSEGPAHADEASSRYTPPLPRSAHESPPWVPAVMFGLLGLGVLVIVLNFTHVLPGGESGWYLLTGLVAITGGIVAATQYR